MVQSAPNDVIQKIESTQTNKQTKKANQHLFSQHQETPNNQELLLNNILSDPVQVQLSCNIMCFKVQATVSHSGHMLSAVSDCISNCLSDMVQFRLNFSICSEQAIASF